MKDVFHKLKQTNKQNNNNNQNNEQNLEINDRKITKISNKCLNEYRLGKPLSQDQYKAEYQNTSSLLLLLCFPY